MNEAAQPEPVAIDLEGVFAPGYSALRAHGLLTLLVALNILNFIDRQLLQSFVVDIMRDLQLSYFQFSLLTGFFFSVSYTLAGVFMGALADRVTRPKLMAAGLFVWSAVTAACGAATNFLQLSLARSFVAIGEGSLSPSALSMISDTFPAQRRGFASGVYYLGIPIGAGGSLLVAGLLGPIIGWRGCFYLLGGLGVLVSAWVLFLRDPPRRGRTESPPPLRRALPEAARLIRKSPPLAYLLLGATLAIFSQGALMLDQAWLVEERGYRVAEAQTIFGVIFLVAGVLGAVAGGFLSDLCDARMRGGRLVFLAATFMLVAPISIAYRFLPPDTPLFYLAAVIGSVALMLPYGPILASAAELAPAHSRALVLAVTIMAMALLGTAGGNAFAGFLTDLLMQMDVAEPLTWALLISGATGLLAVPAFALSARHHPERAELARPSVRPC